MEDLAKTYLWVEIIIPLGLTGAILIYWTIRFIIDYFEEKRDENNRNNR